MCSPPFDRSPSRRSHRWFQPIFIIFPPPPLPPACELLPTVFLFLVLVGGGFFPHLFLKRYLVYYILADLENKVRHLWWPNFLQPNPTLCLSPQQTSVIRTQENFETFSNGLCLLVKKKITAFKLLHQF